MIWKNTQPAMLHWNMAHACDFQKMATNNKVSSTWCVSMLNDFLKWINVLVQQLPWYCNWKFSYFSSPYQNISKHKRVINLSWNMLLSCFLYSSWHCISCQMCCNIYNVLPKGFSQTCHEAKWQLFESIFDKGLIFRSYQKLL